MRRDGLEMFLAVSLGGTLAACTGQKRDDVSQETGEIVACEAQEITLGTGELSFTPLEDDGILHMVYGTQGGYHFPLASRACGVGESASFHYTGALETGESIVDVTLSQLWVPEDACCSIALDVYGYIFLYGYNIYPEDLPGRILQLTLEAEDVTGVQLVDTARVVIGEL